MTRAKAPAAQTWALLCLLAVTACSTTVRQHPDFAERVSQIRKVGFMPPDAQVTLLVFKGDNEPLDAETHAVADQLVALLPPQLAARDFSVENVQLDESAFEQRPELRFESSEVSRAFTQALGEMYASPTLRKGKALHYQRTLGPEINRFADFVDAEALVFARYQGFRKSGGEVTKDVLYSVLIAVATLGSVIPVPPTTGAMLQVCVVDGATGDVLWANQVASAGFSTPNLVDLVKSAMKPFKR